MIETNISFDIFGARDEKILRACLVGIQIHQIQIQELGSTKFSKHSRSTKSGFTKMMDLRAGFTILVDLLRGADLGEITHHCHSLHRKRFVGTTCF
jgi:hypothetical protein